jgi:hypothetical protein
MWLALAAITGFYHYIHLREVEAYEAHIRTRDLLYKEHVRLDSIEIERVNKRLEGAGLFHKGIKINNNHHKQQF